MTKGTEDVVPSRRDEILSAAASLFKRYGYHTTTMQQIADQVGILKGSLYHHFQSKQEILFEMTHAPLEQLVQSVRIIVQSDATPPEKIRSSIKVHIVALSRGHPNLAVITAETDDVLPEGIREEIRHLRRSYQALWHTMVSAGVASGTLDFDAPPTVVVNLILGAVNWLYRWYDPTGAVGPDQLAVVLADMVLHGIGSLNGAAQRRQRRGRLETM